MENSMEPQKIKSRTTIMTQQLYFWNYGSVKESCLTLWDPMNYSPSGSSVLGILYARILQWVALSLLQVIFLTQGSNWGRLHFRQILYCLSYEGSPQFPQYVAKEQPFASMDTSLSFVTSLRFKRERRRKAKERGGEKSEGGREDSFYVMS